MSKQDRDTKRAFINARLLDPSTGLDVKGALLSEGEKIADLGPQLFKGGVPSGIEVIDCHGQCLAPGLLDMRVHLREPGEEHKETIVTAGQAAAAGGITSIAALPDSSSVLDDVAAVEYVARRAREAKMVKVYPYGAITRNLEGKELTEFGLLTEFGAVAFTDSTKALANAQTMRRALSYAKTFNALIVQHPEEPTLAGGVMNGGEIATRMGLSGIPVHAEIIMVERDIRLVEMTGGRYHAAHISTAGAIDVIRQAKKRGLSVTCDTAPHYFCLNENSVLDYRTFAKVSPPLRSESDREAVFAGLADGTIDAIASDHSPHDQDSKRLPFAQAEFGIVGLETLFPLALQLYHKKALSLLETLALVTCKPAKILGIAAGTLAVGSPADLVIFNPDSPFFIDPEKFRSKSKNSPFTGFPAQGKVLRTVVDGRTIYDRATDQN
ncbi:dihydroorotase [Kiloniella laminariae]|uniref:Dihydroorotase n=1 Tax=Kiloniella laminariae TaxID=454162 RepID=A0ABT4LGW3_9PROT|nr:dihydroorotase [Kiloniella laminariae]MCZ4280346.1 dihydroorotase [Kiloniella laminariae]